MCFCARFSERCSCGDLVCDECDNSDVVASVDGLSEGQSVDGLQIMADACNAGQFVHWLRFWAGRPIGRYQWLRSQWGHFAELLVAWRIRRFRNCIVVLQDICN